jgi:hypothetical protein
MAQNIQTPGEGRGYLRPELIRTEVRDIVASSEFARSPRLQKFLSLIVEAAIKDDADSLKETVIGIEVYDRPPTYDPKLEPIVRTEARRLRRKLADYYLHAGKNDPVVISVPMGAYTPRFEIRDAGGADSLMSLVEPPPVRVWMDLRLPAR